MHPHLAIIMMAVVTASCQEARRARSKCTPILREIILLHHITGHLVLQVQYPERSKIISTLPLHLVSLERRARNI
jgi:hypothetical protein